MIRLSQIGQQRPAEPAPAQPARAPLAPPRPLANLLANIGETFGASPEALRGPGRMRSLVRIRQVFCVSASSLGYSSTEISRALNRDHTSVLYLLGKLKKKPSWSEE